MKYRPDFLARFGGIAGARRWAHAFFHWYNEEHHHCRLGLMTPAADHYGRAAELKVQQLRETRVSKTFSHFERKAMGVKNVAKFR
jgi:hypothetical protein